MKTTLLCFLGIFISLLGGCAWAKFRPYEGRQQQWPTGPGGFVERDHAIPVYFSPPPRPYEVIGFIDATTAPVRRNGVVAYAASRAKGEGADAIIVIEEGSEHAGNFAFASSSATTSFAGHYTGTSSFSGRSRYLGSGMSSVSGNMFHRGALSGTGRTTAFGSATSVALYRGRAQVIAIRWK